MAILNWLTQLKHLTQPTAEPVTRDKLASFVGLLAADFDARVFCHASLNAVVAECQFFPAYKELKATLAAWARRSNARQITGRHGGPLRTVEPWILAKILDGCGNDPGPMLRAWLGTKGL